MGVGRESREQPQLQPPMKGRVLEDTAFVLHLK